MPITKHRRRRAVALTAAVAGLALLGGTLAVYTDSDTTDAQILRAGTVAVDLEEGSDWTDYLDNLAVEDVETRRVRLVNSSTLNVSAVKVSADIEHTAGPLGGSLADLVDVSIYQEVGRWDPEPIALHVPLSEFDGDGYTLRLLHGTLPPGQPLDLKISYRVNGETGYDDQGNPVSAPRESSQNPDNQFQGAALSVSYTLDVIQRGPYERTPEGLSDASCVIWDDPQTADVARQVKRAVADLRDVADRMPQPEGEYLELNANHYLNEDNVAEVSVTDQDGHVVGTVPMRGVLWQAGLIRNLPGSPEGPVGAELAIAIARSGSGVAVQYLKLDPDAPAGGPTRAGYYQSVPPTYGPCDWWQTAPADE